MHGSYVRFSDTVDRNPRSCIMLCINYDSKSLSFNPTYRIEHRLVLERVLLAVRKCRDRLEHRRKFRVNRLDFQHKRQASLDSLARRASFARMRGRGDGGRGRNGGRGRFGRGNVESQRNYPRVGMTPEIGAYLDLPRGKEADPESVLKWLECVRIYMYANFKSRITELISGDGSLNEYPEITIPVEPAENSGPIEMEKWKSRNRKYEKASDLLEEESLKLFGILLGQMSEGSKNRIKESPHGATALEDLDPLEVLSLVIATHMNNQRYGEDFNIIAAEMDFYANKMLPNEDLAKYYSRYRTLLFCKSDAYRMADMDAPVLTDKLQAVKFIVSLNSNYSDYIYHFRNKVRPWPLTLADAQADAANYLCSKPGGGNQNTERRNVLAASRGGKAGGRGGRGKGQEKTESETKGSEKKGRSSTPYRERDESPHGEKTGSVQEYGTRYGRCNKCNEEGHYGYECKNKDKAGKKSAAAWNSSSEK